MNKLFKLDFRIKSNSLAPSGVERGLGIVMFTPGHLGVFSHSHACRLLTCCVQRKADHGKMLFKNPSHDRFPAHSPDKQGVSTHLICSLGVSQLHGSLHSFLALRLIGQA